MKKIVKTIVFMWLALFTMSQVATAQTAQGALDTVKESVSVVMQDLKANKAKYQNNLGALDDMLDKKALQYFNERKMAILVLGKNWKNISESQRKTFINEFKQLMMRKYSSQLLSYTGATFSYGEPTAVKNKRAKIPVTIRNNGESYPLILSMGYSKGQWKAYDVKLSGVSLVSSFRSSIGMEVAQKGIDKVIAEIKMQNAMGTVN